MIKKFVKVLANLKNDPIMGYIDITTRFGLIDRALIKQGYNKIEEQSNFLSFIVYL